jgi:hypothetical protein
VNVLYGAFGVVMCVYAAVLFGLAFRNHSRGDLSFAVGYGVVRLGVGIVALTGAANSGFRRTSLLIVGLLLIGDAVSRYVLSRRSPAS